MFLKQIFALKASLLVQIFVLEHQISAGQLSAESSSTETLYCLNGNIELLIRSLISLHIQIIAHAMISDLRSELLLVSHQESKRTGKS